MARKQRWYVIMNCSMSVVGDLDFEDKLDLRAKKYNGELSGAGSDFDVRHINFIFDALQGARKFSTEVRKLPKVKKVLTPVAVE